jgi:ABC-2 type transport system permease protein
MKMDRGNVIAVARREYLARARTRTFKMTTIILVLAGLAVALAPIILRAVFGEGKQATIEVVVGDARPSVDIGATLGAILNAPAGGATTGTEPPAYRVVAVEDAAAARARVLSDKTAGVLVVGRGSSGDLTFEFATKRGSPDGATRVVGQAVSQIAILDRLARAGIPLNEQPQLFAPPAYSVEAADPNAPPPSTNPDLANGGGIAIGFVLAIALFMAIVLYGQWIAYSVVEEKSSRVMEVILGAATPFELLAGKVVGVGGLAITQYAIVFVPATIALLLQDRIAALVFGGTAGPIAAPAGLSVGLLLAFGVFFVLGFALYAVLYAGAASLVSRTEDINQIVAPMTFVSMGGYLVAVYASTGLLDPNSKFVVALSFIPFFSPYLMLTRMSAGVAGPLDVVVAIVLLAVTLPLVLWVAARFYAAGVLMYGQRPSLRLMLRVLRGAR